VGHLHHPKKPIGGKKMKRVRYCDECRQEHEVTVKERTATYTFADEPFEIIEQFAECTICGNEVTDEELDNKTLKKVAKLYEIKHSYNPEALKEIRLSFNNVSQVLFAKLLNMGSATVKRYETGAVSPNSSQLGIYKMLKNDPKSIKNLFDQNKGNFTPDELKIVEEKIAPFMENDITFTSHRVLEVAYQPHVNKVDTGYSNFFADKLFHLVLFFSREGVFKTKLMKLLWYTDFLQYKRMGKPLTGTPYWHMQFGPVPKNHDLVLGCLKSVEFIEVLEEENSEGYTKIIITAKIPFSPSIFSPEEFDVMRYVDEYFASFGSRAITNFSHKEAAWRQTTNEQIIPYSYAKEIQLS
jgi:putative zinc finger/helix-turn-helix YgiT family protein